MTRSFCFHRGEAYKVDRLFPRLLLALDFEERERPHRLARPARAQGAEGFADRAVLEGAAHRDQRVARMIAERGREGDFLLRGGARRGEVGRAEVARAACRQRLDAAARSASLASTICTSVDQPSEGTPRNPLRKAARGLPSSASGSASANMNAPDTAHSPGSAARSNTKVSDGSSRMVRKQLHRRGPPRRGIEPRRRVRARAMSERRSASTLPMRRTRRSPLSSISRRTPLSGASRAR